MSKSTQNFTFSVYYDLSQCLANLKSWQIILYMVSENPHFQQKLYYCLIIDNAYQEDIDKDYTIY